MKKPNDSMERSTPLLVSLVTLVLLAIAGCDSELINNNGRIYAGGVLFGWSLDLDGDVMLAPALETGTGYVLRKSGEGWDVEAELSPSISSVSDFGWSTALDNGIGVISSPGIGIEQNNRIAFVFEDRGESWIETAALSPTDIPLDALFGQPVDISEGAIVASSRWRDEKRFYNRIHVYERVGGEWTETGQIEDPAAEPPHLDLPSLFGRGLAISGNTLAVGSPGQDVDGEQDVGLVRVYERAGDEWVLTATLTNPTERFARGIGEDLAMDGPLLAVKVRGRTTPGTNNPGAVFVYRKVGASWEFEAELGPPTTPSDFGAIERALDVDRDRIAVGVWGAQDGRGGVYVWARQPSGAWVLEAELSPEGYGPGTAFGEDVALDGDRLVASASQIDGERGGVFEFRREGTEWVQVK